MPDQTSTVQTLDLDGKQSVGGWPAVPVVDFVNEAARSIGVGSSTDAGWAPPAKFGTTPILMTGGIPDPDTLPKDQLLAAIQQVLDTAAPDALRYGGYQGFEGLRIALAERASRIDGVSQGPENFVLTNGSAGAIDLVASTFISKGDVVAFESPTFSGSLRTFRGNQAKLVAVPMDDEGMDTNALEELLARQKRIGEPVKAIYTIPNYHNPMGTYMTLERRRHLVDLSARYRMLILEDDAYGEIIFGEDRLPNLYALAGGQGVLRLVTFSKTIATGLRVGWIQGRADFVEACVRMRFDMGSSPLMHRALEVFVNTGQWEAHIEKMRRIYAEKCDALTRGLLNDCEPYVRFQRPHGGFFLWVELLNGIDAQEVARNGAEEGVLVVPGRNFFMDEGGSSHLRLAFSTEHPDGLREGARRLSRAIARAAG